ncbi:MAG: hypothetical protein H7249_05175 [Chitinophagaceae bacterium]|nr:hypothetical protein [Oligoflexus sp.]
MQNAVLRLASTVCLTSILITSCKPSNTESSESSGFTPQKGQASTAVDNAIAFPVGTIPKPIIFNLAAELKKKLGNDPFKNNIDANNQYFYVSSDGETSAKRTIARSIQINNKDADIKTEKFRVQSNFIVDTDETRSEVSAKWFIDAFTLERLIASGAGKDVHSAEITMQAGFTSTGATFGKTTIKVFGSGVITNAATAANPNFDLPSKSFRLGTSVPIFGLPKLGVSAGVAFQGTLGAQAKLDASVKEELSVAFIPTVDFGLNLVAAKAEAGTFAKVEVGGNLSIMEANFPSIITIGGKQMGKVSPYANFTYKTPALNLLKGSLYFLAKVGTGGLSKLINADFWLPFGDQNLTYKSNLWVAKNAWKSINLNGDIGQSIVSPKACATDINAQLATVTKNTAKDTALKKKLGVAAITNLKVMAMKAKAKTGCSKTSTTQVKK